MITSLTIVIVFLLFVYLKSMREDRANDNILLHSYVVIDAAKDLQTTMHDAETRIGGLVNTNDEKYLEFLKKAITPAAKLTVKLKKLTTNNPLQQARVDTLKELVVKEFASGAQQILNATQAKASKDNQLVKSAALLGIAKEIYLVTARFVAYEQALLEARNHKLNVSTRSTFISLFIGAAIVFIVNGFLFVFLYSENKKRQQKEHELQGMLKKI